MGIREDLDSSTIRYELRPSVNFIKKTGSGKSVNAKKRVLDGVVPITMKTNLVYWLVFNGNLFDDSPELIQAERVEDFDFDETRLCFEAKSMASIWPKDIAIYITGQKTVDYLLCSAYYEIVSDRVRNVIESISKNEVEFLPVKLYQDKNLEFPEPFWVPNILCTIDALDWDNTRWISQTPPDRSDPEAYMKIIKPTMREDKIKYAHMFKIIVQGKIDPEIYLSARLKEALEMNGCTVGMEFTPIKVS